MKTSDKILDGQLVQKCKEGDKKAFTLLVKRWHIKFCNQAFWYIKNKDIAKDVAQDSWSTIFKKLHTLHNPNSFGSWALSIVNRKAIDALRKEKRIDKKLHSYYDNEQLNYDEQNDKNINNNNNSDANSNSKIIMNAIYQLPENQRTVLRLFYLEEYSVIEISSLLKVSKGTIKSRLFYAREKLKSILKYKNYEK